MQPRSSLAILQEVLERTRTNPLSDNEQRAIIHLLTELLAQCGQQAEKVLPAGDLSEVRGQPAAKRALEVAAAGGHHLLLMGPLGAGKNRLARTLPSLLPQTAVGYPFRAPDASMEQAALLGDASSPGELTLAHGGVLFLEHLQTFDTVFLALLRQALEIHVVSLGQKEPKLFPAHLQLVTTMMPCPCGYYSDPVIECQCGAETVVQHHRRVKEVVAYLDLQIEVQRPRLEDLSSKRREESSEQVRRRVEGARARQQTRYAEISHLWVNADLASLDEIEQYCPLDAPAQKLFEQAVRQLHLTPQRMISVLRLARTCADLAEAEQIGANHLAEAITYRPRFS